MVTRAKNPLHIMDSELLELLDGNGVIIEDEDAAKAALDNAGLIGVELIITKTP